MAVREIFDLPQLWQRIDALDGRTSGSGQLSLYGSTRALLEHNTRCLLSSSAAASDLGAMIARHRAALAALKEGLEGLLPQGRKDTLRQASERLADNGVPADLACDIARLAVLGQAPAIAEIAQATGADVLQAARTFFEIGERLHIDDLSDRAAAIATVDRYDRLAIAKAQGQLEAAHAAFTRSAIRAGGSEAWSVAQGERLRRAERILTEATGLGSVSLSRLAVAAGTLTDLAAGQV
jgi:glutamate dehydrogenase